MLLDNSSDGWLKKKWIIVSGERLLMKAGSGTNRFGFVRAADTFRVERLCTDLR